MIETPDLLHQLPAIILAGVCAYVWLVARDRRKAVDRLVEEIEAVTTMKHVEMIGLGKTIQAHVCKAGGTKDAQDAPGRVIARSVERMTKGKRG